LPGTDAEWNGQPIFHLIDFLSREHRQFLHGLLPAIKHALEQEHMRNGESLRRLRYLVEEWPRFSSALAEHIHEEEAFLFPKILQYDYCLRHTRNHPDFQGGSVNVFVALRLLGNEKSQMQGIRRFLNELRYSPEPASQEGSLENRLEPLLQDLQARLIKHAELETEILFPMAKAVEKILIDKQIAGVGGDLFLPRVLNMG
jgi:iron-sulfur cluster repair protein YtfE (RIC family)